MTYNHTFDMVFHMKTTLNIDETVMARLKREAARQGRTMSELVETALRMLFRAQKKRGKLPSLPAFRSGGMLADVADRDALYQAMEDIESMAVRHSAHRIARPRRSPPYATTRRGCRAGYRRASSPCRQSPARCAHRHPDARTRNPSNLHTGYGFSPVSLSRSHRPSSPIVPHRLRGQRTIM